MATSTGFEEGRLIVRDFSKGINEQVDDTIIRFNETTYAYNVDNSKGSLCPYELPSTYYTSEYTVKGLASYYGEDEQYIMYCRNSNLARIVSGEDYMIKSGFGEIKDSLCFEYNGKKIVILIDINNDLYMWNGKEMTKLKNRRPKYNEEGELDGYYDADGKECSKESDVTTYSPKCKYVELHYDRLWVSGDPENQDRVYFSTADQRGFDIQDWTMPVDEEEANMHGGFVDVPSFDGGKIIGLKVIFNDLVIFKDKTIFKIYGNNPSNYQIVNLFNTSGAICDKSIACGNNGAFFLNNDGIYFYDGTNVNIISQKIQETIKKIDMRKSMEVACSVYNDNCYMLSVPLKDGSTILIRYNTDTQSYMIYKDLNIKAFSEFDKMLYMIVDNTICNRTPTGKYANMLWETPYNDVGYKNAKKRSEYIYFIAEGEGDLYIDCITDNNTKSISVPIKKGTNVYKKKLKNKGRIFKLRFSTKDGKYVNVTSPELIVEIDKD